MAGVRDELFGKVKVATCTTIAKCQSTEFNAEVRNMIEKVVYANEGKDGENAGFWGNGDMGKMNVSKGILE